MSHEDLKVTREDLAFGVVNSQYQDINKKRNPVGSILSIAIMNSSIHRVYLYTKAKLS